MKICFLFLCSCIVAGILTYFGISVGTNIISTIFNIIGIVFSIGMGLIVTFSISGVENRSYILIIRNNVRQVRQRFIVLFSICTFLFICDDNIPQHILYKINLAQLSSNFTLSFFILSIVYFIINFIRLQNLNNDIFDRLLQEKNQKH